MFKTLLLLFILSMPSLVDAQVRVRGYTRKDGTYVRPHTRSSPGGGSSYSSSSSDDSDDDDKYDFNKMSGIVDGKKISISKKKFVNSRYRLSPTVMLLQPNSYSREAIVIHDDGKLSIDMSGDSTTSPVYLSVFRINGKVADVVAFPRNILYYTTDFSHSLYHSIKYKQVTLNCRAVARAN